MTADSAEPPSHPSPHVDQNAFLDRVAAGDEASRTQFFRSQAPTVDRFVRFAFGLGYDDAADVVQETFITAFTIIDRFDRRRPVQHWLCGIAAMKVKALRRARGRAPTAWSALARPRSDRAAAAGPPSAQAIESALGDHAAVRGADATAGTDADTLSPQEPGRRAPPAPPRPGGDEPHATWGREIGAWLAAQPRETQIIARRFTDGAAYADLAADLGELQGRPVAESAVRQRASRFARDFARRFAQVLPRSRVRVSTDHDASDASTTAGRRPTQAARSGR